MDVFLITILLAMVVGVRGTIISLCLFAHGPNAPHAREANDESTWLLKALTEMRG